MEAVWPLIKKGSVVEHPLELNLDKSRVDLTNEIHQRG